ncbi:MAG TPA: HEPN domain-containing protein [Ktedonobacteraceae bacterium]|nr:HEPN domain-containing protein [Ktedonobacteraceae bacterium]
MSQMHTGSADSNPDDLEQLLTQGVSLEQPVASPMHPAAPALSYDEDDEEHTDISARGNSGNNSDLQGAIGLFAEAVQDMATAGVELGLGRHFACADFCNQAAEKAVQAVSLLYSGRRSPYNHDLQALGELVHAPQAVLDDLATLTPFHPEAFYVGTPPEEADEVISAGQASEYVQNARRVIRWARSIILYAS